MIRVARLTVSAVAHEAGFSYEEIEDLKQAVQEACVERMDSGAARQWLCFSILCGPNAMELSVWGDEADGPVGPSGDETDGVILMGILADSMEFISGPDHRTVIQLRKVHRE